VGNILVLNIRPDRINLLGTLGLVFGLGTPMNIMIAIEKGWVCIIGIILEI